jgi:hypothetical protein
MNDTSRRKFLAAAAAGAGGVAVGTVGLPITSASASASASAPGRRGKEPVVAWIEDPSSDELVLMSGDREVTVRDRALVARLLSATGGK